MHEKTKKYESKRIVTTILKMDENNHYGNAMIKPSLIDVKKKKNLSQLEKIWLVDWVLVTWR